MASSGRAWSLKSSRSAAGWVARATARGGASWRCPAGLSAPRDSAVLIQVYEVAAAALSRARAWAVQGEWRSRWSKQRWIRVFGPKVSTARSVMGSSPARMRSPGRTPANSLAVAAQVSPSVAPGGALS